MRERERDHRDGERPRRSRLAALSTALPPLTPPALARLSVLASRPSRAERGEPDDAEPSALESVGGDATVGGDRRSTPTGDPPLAVAAPTPTAAASPLTGEPRWGEEAGDGIALPGCPEACRGKGAVWRR